MKNFQKSYVLFFCRWPLILTLFLMAILYSATYYFFPALMTGWKGYLSAVTLACLGFAHVTYIRSATAKKITTMPFKKDNHNGFEVLRYLLLANDGCICLTKQKKYWGKGNVVIITTNQPSLKNFNTWDFGMKFIIHTSLVFDKQPNLKVTLPVDLHFELRAGNYDDIIYSYFIYRQTFTARKTFISLDEQLEKIFQKQNPVDSRALVETMDLFIKKELYPIEASGRATTQLIFPRYSAFNLIRIVAQEPRVENKGG